MWPVDRMKVFGICNVFGKVPGRVNAGEWCEWILV